MLMEELKNPEEAWERWTNMTEIRLWYIFSILIAHHSRVGRGVVCLSEYFRLLPDLFFRFHGKIEYCFLL